MAKKKREFREDIAQLKTESIRIAMRAFDKALKEGTVRVLGSSKPISRPMRKILPE